MRATVVGAGVIGLSIAWRAAAAGIEVTVVDPEPGRGASWVAAGMLAPVTEAHYGEEALLALNLASAAAWPAFADHLADTAALDPGYRRCGTLAVARDADDLAVLERLRRYQEELGLVTERLPSRECRRLEPVLAPGVRGGVLVRGDHQVDPRRLVPALVAASRHSGVRFRGASATAVEGSEVAVDDGGDPVEGDVVVLATGAWAGQHGMVPGGALLPVRPVKGQIVRLRPVGGRPLLDRVVRGAEVYLVPRADGELVVGATMEERGFDTTVTAGAVAELLRAAIELVPAIDELELVEARAGLRPGTPDNSPLIGATADDVVVAAGHHRNGILLAPVTADAVVELLTGGSLPEVAAPFSPLRFAEEVPA